MSTSRRQRLIYYVTVGTLLATALILLAGSSAEAKEWKEKEKKIHVVHVPKPIFIKKPVYVNVIKKVPVVKYKPVFVPKPIIVKKIEKVPVVKKIHIIQKVKVPVIKKVPYPVAIKKIKVSKFESFMINPQQLPPLLTDTSTLSWFPLKFRSLSRKRKRRSTRWSPLTCSECQVNPIKHRVQMD